MRRLAIACVVLCLASACVPKKYVVQSPFIEESYSSFTAQGESVVKGQVFGKTWLGCLEIR